MLLQDSPHQVLFFAGSFPTNPSKSSRGSQPALFCWRLPPSSNTHSPLHLPKKTMPISSMFLPSSPRLQHTMSRLPNFLEPPPISSEMHANGLTFHVIYSPVTEVTPAARAPQEMSEEDDHSQYDAVKIPPVELYHQRLRLDSVTPVYTSSIRSTLSPTMKSCKGTHVNEEPLQNHLTRHSPPVQPNEPQSTPIGLPSFQQVRLPALVVVDNTDLLQALEARKQRRAIPTTNTESQQWIHRQLTHRT